MADFDVDDEDDFGNNLKDSQTITHSQLMFQDDYMSRAKRKWGEWDFGNRIREN